MPVRNNHSLLSRVSAGPLLLSPDAEQVFLTSLNELTSHEEYPGTIKGSTMASMSDDDFWGDDDWARPYTVSNGILQIPVSGVLLNRFPYQFGRMATGYQYIERAFNRGMDDPEVQGIAFLVDSPGGEVAGNFELVDKIFARRGEKPIRAYAADHAYSAAYSIASAADSITVSRSGGVGSVGVVTAHVEFSDALKQDGVKVTFIFAGDHKTDGNPYERLPERAKARIQERIDRIYGEFTGMVARNRGMDEQAVRDTEALTFDASESISVGFADKVGAMEEELVIFSQEAEPEKELMTTKAQTSAAQSENGQTFTQGQMDAATEAARTEGQAAGVTAERERMNTILQSPEGVARPVAAMAAIETGMAADVAIAMLAKLSVEKTEQAAAPEAPATPAPAAPKGQSPFDSAMGTGNPEVGAEDNSAGGGEPNPAAAILSDFRSATGIRKVS